MSEFDTPTDPEAGERLLADAHALQRLAQHEDWPVLDRLLAEQMTRVQRALRARGLDPVQTEALRAELDVIEWLRERPSALARALEERDKMSEARAFATRTATLDPDRELLR
jgi:hypothetical protein